MGLLTNGVTTNFNEPVEVRRKEIRALALQAAATFYANRNLAGSSTHVLLEKAREFEAYIDEGRIPEVDDA